MSCTDNVAKRKPVTGAKGCEISPDGQLYRYRHKVKPIGKVPVVDLPLDYTGRLMPVHGDGTRGRFLDEIVAYEFHGPYPAPYRFVHVLHLDGDWQNCAADNVRWVVDDEWFELNGLALSSRWMHPDTPPAGVTLGVVKGVDSRYPCAPYHGAKYPRYSGIDDPRLALLPECHELPVATWVNDRRKADQENRMAS